MFRNFNDQIMEKFKFIRPEIPKREIDYCLESFDKKEAAKRIFRWIEDAMDNVEMQIKNYENMHHVSGCAFLVKFEVIGTITVLAKDKEEVKMKLEKEGFTKPFEILTAMSFIS